MGACVCVCAHACVSNREVQWTVTAMCKNSLPIHIYIYDCGGQAISNERTKSEFHWGCWDKVEEIWDPGRPSTKWPEQVNKNLSSTVIWYRWSDALDKYECSRSQWRPGLQKNSNATYDAEVWFRVLRASDCDVTRYYVSHVTVMLHVNVWHTLL